MVPSLPSPDSETVSRLIESAQAAPVAGPGGDATSLGLLARHLLLERFGPAAVLVDRDACVLQMSGPVERYLLPVEVAGADLVGLAREELAAPLRELLAAPAAATRTAPARPGGLPVRISVFPLPARDVATSLRLLVFEDDPGRLAIEPADRDAAAASGSVPVARQQARLDELEQAHLELARMLAGTDLAALCLDRQRRIAWFSPALTRLLALLPGDCGRPISDFAFPLEGADLETDVGRVLREVEPVERAVRTSDGRWLLQRVLPYRPGPDGPEGAMVTFTDITETRRTGASLEALNSGLAQRLEERTRQLALLQQAGDIANRSYTLEEALAETLQLMCAHGGWVVGRAVLADFEDPDSFADAGIWWLAPGRDYSAFTHQVEGASYRADADPLGSVLAHGHPSWVGDFSTREPSAWTEAAQAAGLRSALLLPVIVRGRIMGAIKLYADRTTERDDAELRLMTQVATEFGRAVERERFIQRLTDLADEEWRRIAQELHDGIGQQLAGVGLLSTSARQAMASGQVPDAALIANIARGVDEARAQVRALTKGLLPVQLGAHELVHALDELVGQFSQIAGIDCRFSCPAPPAIADDAVATHLYGIAQEAVRNAVQHARARHVLVVLDARERIVLSITDDGAGIEATRQRAPGSGMRIMRYRADLIGGTLSVETRSPGGVAVTCSLPRRAHRPRTPGAHGPYYRPGTGEDE